MRRLLSEGADVSSPDSAGYLDTPLSKAASRGHVDACKLLLVSGAPPSAANAYGWTPLHYAAASGFVDAARLLLVWGASADAAERDGDTSLHVAAFSGHTATCALLLAWGANTELARTGSVTPLHWAAQQGHARVVEVLAERGARTDCRDSSGDGPLHSACRAGKVAAARSLLLVANADLLAAGAGGDSPLHAAVGSPACTPELVALLLGEAQARRMLPQLVSAVSMPQGWTALHAVAAAAAGSAECAAALLEAGADPSARAADGKTPFELASTPALRELLAVTETVEEVGADAEPRALADEPPSVVDAPLPVPAAVADAVLASAEETAVPAEPAAPAELAPSARDAWPEEETAVAAVDQESWHALADAGPERDDDDEERGWEGEAGPFEALCLRLGSRALSRLNDRVSSALEFERALALELAAEGLPFSSARVGPGFRIAGGLLLLSEPPGSVEECVRQLQAVMDAEPELETVGVIHLCPAEGVDARFLSRGEEA